MLLLVSLVLCMCSGCSGASFSVDWSSDESPLSLYVSVGDSVRFSSSTSLSYSVSSVASLSSDSSDARISLSLSNSAPSATLEVTEGLGDRVVLRDLAGGRSKAAVLYVARDYDVLLGLEATSGAPQVTRVEPGARVLWSLGDALQHRARVWIQRVDSSGSFLEEGEEPVLLMGPLAPFYAVSFPEPTVFHWSVPLLPGLSSTIVVGEPLVPVVNSLLECSCIFPSLPCVGEPGGNASDPLLPTVPPLRPPAPLSPYEGVWVVSPTRGSNCPDSPGTMLRPFRSIGRAVCAASDGDVVFVETGGDLYEDMDLWYNCTTCASFSFEEHVPSAVLGSAQLLSGGTVHLRRTRSTWEHETTNFHWFNSHKYVHLKDEPLEPMMA